MPELAASADEVSTGSSWRWLERPVKIVDGTTVMMPGTPENPLVSVGAQKGPVMGA
jgi:hypothetical protein